MEKESEDSKEVSRGRRERASANEEKKDESEIASSKGGRRRRENETKEDTGNLLTHSLTSSYSFIRLFTQEVVGLLQEVKVVQEKQLFLSTLTMKLRILMLTRTRSTSKTMMK